ncbi:MAG: glycosyltransferase family 2 protein [Thermoplasmataceae archaeon]
MSGIFAGNPVFLAYIFLLVLIFLGLLYVSLFRQKAETYTNNPNFRVLVILPCRGIDYGMEENFRSLTHQSYANFSVVGVVDSEDDPSADVLRKAGIKFIVSRASCTGCSGKVRAIVSAFEAFSDYDVYVIADSDILCNENWLLNLVRPLMDSRIGISTTFPYFKPIGGFWSTVKMTWGFVGLGMMESRLTRFGWGGSLAFRKELLDGRGMHFFRNFVSDDIALTKICKARKLGIAYVKEASPVIRSPENFSQFIEWANRQTALSIYATRNVFRYGVIYYGGTVLLLISSIWLSVTLNTAFLILLLPIFINAARTFLRSRDRRVRAFFISLVISFIYLFNLARARTRKKIIWRGREYTLDGESGVFTP